MTEKQYEEYTRINDEVRHLKDFLMWCGKKYKDNFVGKYPFVIDTKTKRFNLRSLLPFSSIPDNTYEISAELQSRIIETIENYVNEKEQRLQEI